MSKRTHFFSLVTAVFMFLAMQLSAVEQAWTLGKNWFEHLEESYNQGRYTTFLNEIEEQYLKEAKEGRWNKITEEVLRELAANEDPEKKKQIEEDLVKITNYSKDAVLLEKEKDQKLQEVAQNYPQYPISKVIENHFIDYEQFVTVNTLSLLAFWNLDGNSETPHPFSEYLEIAKEFWIKTTFLFSEGLVDSQHFAMEWDKTEDLLTVLGFEKYRKMREQNNREDLKVAYEQFRNLRPLFHNQAILIYLGGGSLKPADPAEEEVAKIMADYTNKNLELLQKHEIDFGLSKEQQFPLENS